MAGQGDEIILEAQVPRSPAGTPTVNAQEIGGSSTVSLINNLLAIFF